MMVLPSWGVKQAMLEVLSLVSSDFSELSVFTPIYSLYTRISFTVSVSHALEPLSEI